MQVSIIIVSYNTCDLLRECILSVKEKTTDLQYEIIVMDNASSDSSVDMLRKQFPDVCLIESNENLGFGRANNLALEKAVGEFILFLNPDTLLKNNAIKILSEFLIRNPEVGLCGGNLYDAEGHPNLSFQRPHTLWTEFVSLMPDSFKSHQRKVSNRFNVTGKARKVKCISGADIMVRKEILDHIGGFDSDFFMYYEDMELCRRVTKNCWDVVSVPQAKITHLEGQSCTISDLKLEMLLTSKFIYYTKTRSKTYARTVYTLRSALYQLYNLMYILNGNVEKRERYDFWSSLNENAWTKHCKGKNT